MRSLPVCLRITVYAACPPTDDRKSVRVESAAGDRTGRCRVTDDSGFLGTPATAGGEQFIAYAILLALMVGIFQFFLGVARLGLVVNFLSHPVVNGFTNAAALIIATSQLNKIFGVQVEKAEHHYETIIRVVESAVHWTHLPTFAMAVVAFAVTFGLRRLNPRLPNVLIAVVVTSLLAWVFGFERNQTLSAGAVDSPRLPLLIEEFNSAVTEQRHMEQLRSDMCHI